MFSGSQAVAGVDGLFCSTCVSSAGQTTTQLCAGGCGLSGYLAAPGGLFCSRCTKPAVGDSEECSPGSENSGQERDGAEDSEDDQDPEEGCDEATAKRIVRGAALFGLLSGVIMVAVGAAEWGTEPYLKADCEITSFSSTRCTTVCSSTCRSHCPSCEGAVTSFTFTANPPCDRSVRMTSSSNYCQVLRRRRATMPSSQNLVGTAKPCWLKKDAPCDGQDSLESFENPYTNPNPRGGDDVDPNFTHFVQNVCLVVFGGLVVSAAVGATVYAECCGGCKRGQAKVGVGDESCTPVENGSENKGLPIQRVK